MRRIVLAIAALLLLGGAVAYFLRGPLTLRLMERVVASNLGAGRLDELPDGLHVGLCGAGSPLPDPIRSGPCVAVVAGEALYVVDAGAGASRVLARLRLPQSRVRGVLLTHFHSDHIDGLGELLLQRWAGGAHDAPLPVHGPPGVEEVVDGFNRAYAQDAAYRVAHHGADVVPPTGAGGAARTFAVAEDGAPAVVLEDGGLTVEAFRVDHAPVAPAVGYRFTYAGRSVVVSGDTSKSSTVERMARGADVLVHEALSPELVAVLTRAAARAGAANLEKITTDIVGYHTTPREAAEIARDAGVRYLLLYHVVPPLPLAPLEEIFLRGVDDIWRGPVTVGRDGSFVSLPAGSDTVEYDELL